MFIKTRSIINLVGDPFKLREHLLELWVSPGSRLVPGVHGNGFHCLVWVNYYTPIFKGNQRFIYCAREGKCLLVGGAKSVIQRHSRCPCSGRRQVRGSQAGEGRYTRRVLRRSKGSGTQPTSSLLFQPRHTAVFVLHSLTSTSTSTSPLPPLALPTLPLPLPRLSPRRTPPLPRSSPIYVPTPVR